MRQLENLCHWLTVMAPGQTIEIADLPPELRNRITRFVLDGARSAGTVSLTDDSLKRRKIALIRMGPEQETLQLLSPLHYLRQGLSPSADIIEGNLASHGTPMRRLIDRISELATDPDSNVAADAPLVKELEGLVEWLLGNFDRDLSTFDEALARLEQLATREADRRAERLSQVTREAERQEALARYQRR